MNRQCLLRSFVSLVFLANATLWWIPNPVQARYMRPDLENVPVERLIKNLEMLIEKNPKDAKLVLNLARVHAMAYALKTETAEVNKKQPTSAWFGYEPKHVPFTLKKTDDPAKKKAAAAHLEQAIERYWQAVKLAPENVTAALGLTWCLGQSEKGLELAIDQYRRIIELAWKKEKDLKTAGLGWHSVTAEAASYLIPLLDKTKDAEEIKTLTERIRVLQKVRRPVTPLVIPLRPGLGVQDLVDLKAKVAFDADGSGVKHQWSWISKDAGWLVYDHRKSGKIDSALQMFGSVTFWMLWENGYQALNVFDTNQDGWLTGNELEGLAVWVDANGNGVVDAGELKTLSDLGIVALACRGQTTPTVPHTAAHAPAGVRFRDGTTRPTFDVLLYRR